MKKLMLIILVSFIGHIKASIDDDGYGNAVEGDLYATARRLQRDRLEDVIAYLQIKAAPCIALQEAIKALEPNPNNVEETVAPAAPVETHVDENGGNQPQEIITSRDTQTLPVNNNNNPTFQEVFVTSVKEYHAIQVENDSDRPAAGFIGKQVQQVEEYDARQVKNRLDQPAPGFIEEPVQQVEEYDAIQAENDSDRPAPGFIEEPFYVCKPVEEVMNFGSKLWKYVQLKISSKKIASNNGENENVDALNEVPTNNGESKNVDALNEVPTKNIKATENIKAVITDSQQDYTTVVVVVSTVVVVVASFYAAYKYGWFDRFFNKKSSDKNKSDGQNVTIA